MNREELLGGRKESRRERREKSMNMRWMVRSMAGLTLGWMSASFPGALSAAPSADPAPRMISERKLAQIVPGKATKAQVQSLLGAPWRVVQFNDCGAAMPDQDNETWDYRGTDAHGTYRVHIEFDDHGVTHLVARIPEKTGGRGTTAKVAPASSMKGMPM
jgi:hypothetical protein